LSSSIESFNKLKIKRAVSLFPGVHLRELQRLLGISFNSTRYHVINLSQTGEIVCQKGKGYSRLYPVGTNERDKEIYPLLRSKTCRTILKALAGESHLTNKEISNLTGLAKSTISEHIQRFIDARIVRTLSFPEQGGTRYELQDPNYILGLLAKTEETALDVAVSRFVDMWEI
jgi:predicted transcriptional regulator